MVIETPPKVLGIIDDAWFQYVTDFGNAGPDKGTGGKFLLLPPGYRGDVPQGYYVARTKTFGNWVVWRGFQVNGSSKLGKENYILKGEMTVYETGNYDGNWRECEARLYLSDDCIYYLCSTYLKTSMMGTLEARPASA